MHDFSLNYTRIFFLCMQCCHSNYSKILWLHFHLRRRIHWHSVKKINSCRNSLLYCREFPQVNPSEVASKISPIIFSVIPEILGLKRFLQEILKAISSEIRFFCRNAFWSFCRSFERFLSGILLEIPSNDNSEIHYKVRTRFVSEVPGMFQKFISDFFQKWFTVLFLIVSPGISPEVLHGITLKHSLHF